MKLIQFLGLYIIAIAISISSVYAHFHYSSIIRNKGINLKNVILLLILWVTYVILCILIPAEIIYIGVRSLNPREWENSWGKYALFLMVTGSLIPSLIIAIKKNREIEREIRKRRDTEKKDC